MAVAPSFIDLHNHSDFRILKPKTRPAANYLTHCFTTMVTGNCGGGQLNVKDYLDRVDQPGAGTNIVHLIPHGALRASVLGRTKRQPTPDQLMRMRQLATRAMNEGAWGMSTGLIYVPCAYAETDEIVALAEVVAAAGGI